MSTQNTLCLMTTLTSDSFRDWLRTIPELSGAASTARVQSLCSDIAPQKATNPAAYSANVSWWRRTLSNLLESGSQPSSNHLALELDDSVFESITRSAGRRPLAIASVVVCMRNCRSISSLPDFFPRMNYVIPKSSSALRVS